MAENQTKQSAKERLKEITDSIEVGIKEMYESDKYAQYLRTMSRFHRYSVNNTLLIAMQRPDATQVAGFNKWRDSFKRTVKKGEKGIKIIAPTPYKVTEQQTKLDPQTKAPILDANGKVQTEEVEKQIPMFRVVSVFDVSQTYGEPLPTLASDLTGNVEQYEIFMEAVKRSAPVPIAFEKMPEDTDGYYHTEDKRIAIREDMSEVQTVSATIHEVAHSLLHDRQSKQEQQAQQDETATPPQPIDRRTEEVQAESISFAVCSYYGIETGENSFGYIANWSKGKELSELKASLEVINKTSSQLITDIDRHFAEIVKERGIDLTAEATATEQEQAPDKIAYQVGENFLAIHNVEGGNEYSFYDKDYNLIDGGVHDDPEWTVYDVARDVLAEGDVPPFADLTKFTVVDFDELTEKAENVAMSKVVGSIKYSDLTNEFILSNPDFVDHDVPLYTNRDGEKFAFGFGTHLGGDTVVWNYLDESNGDYKTVAHIDDMGNVSYAVDNLPDTAKAAIEQQAITILAETEIDEDIYADKGHITEDGYNISIDGHIGTWYVADTEIIEEKQYFLLEHEEHGDNAACLIVDSEGNIALDDVWNGFDDLKYHLEQTHTIQNTTEPKPSIDYNYHRMPDKTVSMLDYEKYSEQPSADMLPIGKNKALQLLDADFSVFALHNDGTETMLFDNDEINAHDGLFGVEKVEWEQLYEKTDKDNEGLSLSEEVEQDFVDGKDHIAIYQVKRGFQYRDYSFENTERLAERGLEVERQNYNLVYTAPLKGFDGDINRYLNRVYEEFNINHPVDFKGHSLSVSDIVAINTDGVVSSHYVDSFGFTEQPLFLRDVEVENLIGEDLIFVDEETGKVTWMYFNENGSDGGHFVENNLDFEDIINASKETTDPDVFFNEILGAEALQYLGDVGTEHFYDMKKQFTDGTHIASGLNENSMRELVKRAENYLRATELSKEQNYNMIDSQLNNEPIVGKIDYLGTNGEVVETMEYTDKDRFEKQVKEDNYYGVPMTVTAYGETSLGAESFDPPPQGFKVEQSEGKDLPTVAQLEHDAKNGKPISLMDLLDATRREQKAKPQQKKEKTAPSKGAETER